MLHLKTFCTSSIGWALFGVNFRPLQEIEAIIGEIFDTGPFFARLTHGRRFWYYALIVIKLRPSHTTSLTTLQDALKRLW